MPALFSPVLPRACVSPGFVVFCLLVFLLKCSEQPSSRWCQHFSKDKQACSSPGAAALVPHASPPVHQDPTRIAGCR